jgi:signal peptidase I
MPRCQILSLDLILKPGHWLLVGLAAFLAEVTTYFANPLHTASLDLVIRLYGFKLYQQRSDSMFPTIGGFVLRDHIVGKVLL